MSGTAVPDRDWGALSPAEVAEAVAGDPVLVLPLGATEQHGPHLPLSTDVDIGAGLLAEALRRVPEEMPVWTLPMVEVGVSLEHARFPGTASVSAEHLVELIVDRGAELAALGVRRLVLSNSHGGNRYAMEAAGLRLRAEHDMLVVKSSWPRLGRPDDVDLPEREWIHGLHGGAVETAMMLHLRPEVVRTDAITEFASFGAELAETLRRVGPEGQASFSWLAGDLNPGGVVGDASLATAEMGARLVAHYGAALAEVMEETSRFPVERLSRAPGSSAVIDESRAWTLVRAARNVGVSGDPPPSAGSRPSAAGSGSYAAASAAGVGPPPAGIRRVDAPSAPGVWLDVRPDGSWSASTPTTQNAEELLDLFVPVVAMPDFVIGQLGQSLDGRIATESGASHYVTGQADLARLHRLRALVDAVIVGASTVEHDDPRLTVRLVEGENPVRVVLDPSARLEAGRRVVDTVGGPALVVRGQGGPTETDDGATPRSEDYEVLYVPCPAEGALDLEALLAVLRARGLRRILVEGGGRTVSSFLERGLLDRLHLTVSPMIIGSGRPSIILDPVASLDDALRPAWRRFTLGADVLYDLDLRARPE